MGTALNVIQHNMMAMFTDRQLGITTNSKAKSSEKLASGYKINRAADDAAGLSISEKMRRQIRGLNQGTENVKDGISFCQTADGALNEISSMVVRLKELSVKAANGTNSPSDRQNINDEVQQIKKEMDRILTTTKFNETNIWEDEGQYDVEMVPDWVMVPALLDSRQTVTAFTVNNSYSTVGRITNDNKAVWPPNGFKISANEDGMTVKWTGYNGNTYESDLMEWKDGNQCTYNLKDYLSAYSGDPELVGINFPITYTKNQYTQLSDLVNYYNNKTVSITPYTSQSMELYDSAGNRLSNKLSASVSLTYPAVVKSEMNLDDSGDSSVISSPANHSDTTFIEPTGSKTTNLIEEPVKNADGTYSGTWKFSFQMDNIGTVTGTCTGITYRLTTGDIGQDNSPNRDTVDYKNSNTHRSNKWWGYYSKYTNPSNGNVTYYSAYNSYSASGNIAGYLNALNGSGGAPGLLTADYDGDRSDSGTITLSFNLTANSPYKIENSRTSYSSVGNFTISVSMNESESLETIVNRVLSIDGADIYTGSTNSDTAGSNSGSYVHIYPPYSSPSKPETVKVPGLVQEWGEVPKLDEQGKMIKHYHPTLNGVSIHSTDTSTSTGKIDIVHSNLSVGTLGLEDTNVLTVEDAEKAMDAVETAGKMVDAERAVFGAYQNRLEHTLNNNNNVVENTTSSESLLRDTNMADEMVRFSNLSIIQQAGQSMLTQANQSRNYILSLLG